MLQSLLTNVGKYTWIERSYEEAKPVSKKAKDDYIIPDSKLEAPIQVCPSFPGDRSLIVPTAILQLDLFVRVSTATSSK